MTLYYVNQFGLYYAGKDKDGTFVFTNTRIGTPAKSTREVADKLVEELGTEGCEVEERVL